MFINIDEQQKLPCIISVFKKSEQLQNVWYVCNHNYDYINKESREDLSTLILGYFDYIFPRAL